MAYQSLYRRYRPHRFGDVRGQDHVVRALQNAVRDERVGHAYLFSGPRGTGKTSTARILAKALNCEHLVEGEPCGTCDSCLAIDAGSSFDVQELDAASNNGVEDVKDLIARVNLGSPGRTKVYILDEVHMLSTAASNKLLKTLEEPPDHVVFVLATTDPQKVLPTIRSRTQHFEFHLLSAEELAAHVAWVIADAGLDLDPSVIDPVVRAGNGSARDTLSALDKVAAAGGVLDDGNPVDAIIDAIATPDTAKALLAVADAVGTGRDPRVLADAVLGRLRDIFLLRMGAPTHHLTPDDTAVVRAWADQLSDRATTRALEVVGDALLSMRQAPDPRIPLDVALVKLTRTDGDVSIDGLLDRVARLEAAIAGGAALPAAGPAPAAVPSASDRPGRGSTAPAPTPSTPATAASQPPAGAPAPDPAAAAPLPARDAERTPPPARPSGGRPADIARAELAAQRGERGAAPARPGTAPAAPSGPPAAPPRPERAPGPRSAAPPAASPPAASPAPATAPGEAAPRPSAASADAPAPAAAPTASDSTASVPAASDSTASAPTGAAPTAASTPPIDPAAGLANVEQLLGLWNDGDLPGLRGMVKAMFREGRFTHASGDTAVLALPNEVHRQKCEQRRVEVEAALTERAGFAVRLQLVVDEGGDTSAPPASGDRSRRATESGPELGPEPDDFDLGGTDVHDLDDAPDAPAGGLDALTEAFPGAELVEGT